MFSMYVVVVCGRYLCMGNVTNIIYLTSRGFSFQIKFMIRQKRKTTTTIKKINEKKK